MSQAAPGPPQDRLTPERLDSWKEIASHLGRDIRTVQRWEKEEGLPVHRHPHKKAGSVHAFTAEVETWWKARQSQVDPGEPAPRFAVTAARVGAALAFLAAGVLIARWISGPGEPGPRLQTDIALPPQSLLTHGPSLALSPDGATLAMAASGGLWLRSLRDASFRLLPGTRDALAPFWSPDGRQIGFFADGKLKRLTLPSGPAVELADAPAPQGGSWSSAGVIVFAPNLEGPLSVVRAAGGPPAALTRLDAGSQDYLHAAPHFLPGGERFLYLAKRRGRDRDAVMAGTLGARAAHPAFVAASGGSASYAPGGEGDGFLLFARGGDLVAQPFDTGTLRLSGAARVLAGRVRTSQTGVLDMSVASRSGALVYAANEPKTNRLQWFSRQGVPLEGVGEAGAYRAMRLSPDHRRLLSVRDGATESDRSLWCLDLDRGVDTKLLSGRDLDDPVWSSDGLKVVFSWDRDGRGANLYTMRAESPAEPVALLPSGRDRWPLDWSADGRTLLFAEIDPVSKFDVWSLPVAGGAEAAPRALARGPGKDNEARFSPDGRFVAYQSDESGHVQVYVRALPPASGVWQISSDHGAEPRWRGDGGELYYLSGDSALMAVPMTGTGAGRRPGKPVRLFGSGESRQGVFVWKYEPGLDGQRFLVLTPEQSPATPVHFALNWSR